MALLRTIEGHGAAVRGLAFDGGGGTLYSSADDGRVCAWDVCTGSAAGAAKAVKGGVGAIALSPEGKRLLLGGNR